MSGVSIQLLFSSIKQARIGVAKPPLSDIYGRIYAITNLVNGKYYIGQTIRPLCVRWRDHLGPGSKCERLKQAIRKYGKESFEVQVVAEATNQEHLDLLELLWILATNATNNTVGYNVRYGGNTGRLSEDTRRKMSVAKKGVKFSDAHKHALSVAWKPKVMSEEGRVRWMAARHNTRGRKHTAEARKRISEGRRGIKLHPEVYERITARNRGQKRTPEQRQQMSERQKGKSGRPKTQEEIDKIAAAHRGRKNSEETKAKMREAALKREAAKRNQFS